MNQVVSDLEGDVTYLKSEVSKLATRNTVLEHQKHKEDDDVVLLNQELSKARVDMSLLACETAVEHVKYEHLREEHGLSHILLIF